MGLKQIRNIPLKIVHLCQRLVAQIKLLPQYIKNFGLRVALFIVWDRLFPPGRSKSYQKAVYKYLESRYGVLAKEYKPSVAKGTETNHSQKTIWVCWLQGPEHMPELVKMCYDNLLKKVNDATIKIVLLTHSNIEEYVSLPEHIKQKYKEGKINNAHYSDIIRVKLMRHYGGCWLDATVYVTEKIDNSLFTGRFFTMKMHAQKCPKEPCQGLWTNFFYSSVKDNPLFCILDEMLNRYWRYHNIYIDYVFLDYLMIIAFRNNRFVKEVIDAVPFNNEKVWLLWNNIEKEYNESSFQKIIQQGQYFKLSYQKDLKKEIGGKLTIYGHLVKNN